VAALQTSLQLAAMREFELLGVGDDRANPLLLDRLRACCLVVDVLGPKARCRPARPPWRRARGSLPRPHALAACAHHRKALQPLWMYAAGVQLHIPLSERSKAARVARLGHKQGTRAVRGCRAVLQPARGGAARGCPGAPTRARPARRRVRSWSRASAARR